MNRDRALALIFDTLDLVNAQLPPGQRLARRPDTVLVGAGGVLDSLGLVTFVLALEERLEAALGRAVPLLDPEKLTPDGAFHTVDSLSRFLGELMSEASETAR